MFTISLTVDLQLLARTLDRLVSLVAQVGDGVRRVRYRRVEFRRLSASETVSDPLSNSEAVTWVPPVRLHGRPHIALKCHSNSRVSYDVTLPVNASVVSWCALAPEAANGGGVEFEIHVRAQGLESSARRLVELRRGWRHRRWHSLSVRTPSAGPARVVLTTRVAGGGDRVGALWGDPGIQVPRSVAGLASALRTAIAAWGVRGLWNRSFLANGDRLYGLWVREHKPSRELLRAQRRESSSRTRTFTLITSIVEPTAWSPRRVAESVVAQSYPRWEWILVAADDERDQVREAVGWLKHDRRVRILGVPSNSTRADAWNAGLREAHGEFAALLDQHDVLAPTALYEMADALDAAPDCDLVYSDEDLIGRRRRHDPQFKPDWSPQLLLANNFVGRMAFVRVNAANVVGRFRNGFEGAEEWDLFLRLSRQTGRIRRVPSCLYHRDETNVSDISEHGKVTVRDHGRELGLDVEVVMAAGSCRLVWPVRGNPVVSVVIPSRDAAAVLKKCVAGLLHGTNYPSREVVIVDNGSTEQEVFDLYRSLQRDGSGTIVPFSGPFNFSAACNAGAAAARGDLLLFLNNDIEVIQADWLEELVRWAQLPDVGIVGAKLLYPDRTVQHAGIVFGLGLVGHIFSRAAEGTTGLFGSAECYRNYLAVTGACQMMRRDVFRKLGGYDERFRLSFSDVVLCMEAWKAGLRVVYTPYARLVHHESYTRKREDWPQDLELLVRYLKASGFDEDPYFHPELNPKSSVPALRPPFDPTPRQAVHEYIDRVLASAAV